MNIIKKIGLPVLVMFGIAQVSSAAQDYSKMSAHELNEALIIAVKKGSSDDVQKLIKAGADVNQKISCIETMGDCDYNITYTPLEYAAKCDYVDLIKELIRIKAKNDDINKALIIAAQKGHADVVRELVQAKAKIDAINTALISATKKFPGCTNRTTISNTHQDYLNVIKELIKAGAHVNHTDEWENTALIEVVGCSLYTEAQKKNKGEVIQALLNAKANVNHANKEGSTALIRAIEKHDFNVVQILLKVPGIKINHANKDGNTALIKALQCLQYTYVAGDKEQYNNCFNSQKILETLLQIPGIDLHHANKNGDTAVTLLKKLEEKMNG